MSVDKDGKEITEKHTSTAGRFLLSETLPKHHKIKFSLILKPILTLPGLILSVGVKLKICKIHSVALLSQLLFSLYARRLGTLLHRKFEVYDIKMGYHISKIANMGQSSILKSDVLLIFQLPYILQKWV